MAILRTVGLTGVVPSLIGAAGLLAGALAVNALRRRTNRRAQPPPPPPTEGGFPVPPIPVKEIAGA